MQRLTKHINFLNNELTGLNDLELALNDNNYTSVPLDLKEGELYQRIDLMGAAQQNSEARIPQLQEENAQYVSEIESLNTENSQLRKEIGNLRRSATRSTNPRRAPSTGEPWGVGTKLNQIETNTKVIGRTQEKILNNEGVIASHESVIERAEETLPGLIEEYNSIPTLRKEHKAQTLNDIGDVKDLVMSSLETMYSLPGFDARKDENGDFISTRIRGSPAQNDQVNKYADFNAITKLATESLWHEDTRDNFDQIIDSLFVSSPLDSLESVKRKDLGYLAFADKTDASRKKKETPAAVRSVNAAREAIKEKAPLALKAITARAQAIDTEIKTYTTDVDAALQEGNLDGMFDTLDHLENKGFSFRGEYSKTISGIIDKATPVLEAYSILDTAGKNVYGHTYKTLPGHAQAVLDELAKVPLATRHVVEMDAQARYSGFVDTMMAEMDKHIPTGFDDQVEELAISLSEMKEYVSETKRGEIKEYLGDTVKIFVAGAAEHRARQSEIKRIDTAFGKEKSRLTKYRNWAIGAAALATVVLAANSAYDAAQNGRINHTEEEIHTLTEDVATAQQTADDAYALAQGAASTGDAASSQASINQGNISGLETRVDTTEKTVVSLGSAVIDLQNQPGGEGPTGPQGPQGPQGPAYNPTQEELDALYEGFKERLADEGIGDEGIGIVPTFGIVTEQGIKYLAENAPGALENATGFLPSQIADFTDGSAANGELVGIKYNLNDNTWNYELFNGTFNERSITDFDGADSIARMLNREFEASEIATFNYVAPN